MKTPSALPVVLLFPAFLPALLHPAPPVLASGSANPPSSLLERSVIFVANQRGASVSVLDATSKAVIATLPTGDGPHEVAVSPDGKIAVVTNYGGQTGPGNSLTVVDVATHSITSTISLGEYRRPHGAVFLPGGRRLIVTSETNQAVVIVDLDSAKVVHAIPTTQQGSHLIAVRADGKMGYTGNVRSGSITEIDIAGRATGRVLPVATNTEGIGVTPDGSEVWVASRDQHKLFVVNTKQWKVTDTLDAPGTPYRVAFSADGKTAFVPSPSANVIRTFDAKTKKAHTPTQMPDGCQPVGIAVGHDGTTAYAACGQSATLQFIDVKSNAVTGNLPTGPAPDGVAIARMN